MNTPKTIATVEQILRSNFYLEPNSRQWVKIMAQLNASVIKGSHKTIYKWVEFNLRGF